MDLTILLVGLLGLWLGTDFALEGALRISRRFGVSRGFVGLTVLAIGTGLPELVVGIVGGVEQVRGLEASGVVVGNATGSVITQGALVLGISGLMAYLRLARRMIRRDGITLLLAVGLFAVVGFDGTIGRSEGIALILVYSVYLVALLQAERSGRREPEPQRRRALWDFMTVAIGMAAVIVSAHLVVTRAISIAQLWGVSQTVIGIFLVGAGTSLPELALSVRAATKGQSSISVGNIIGSNTFDMLVPIGASAAIFPLAVSDSTLAFDIPVIGLITIATLIFFLHRKGLQKSEAAALLLIYMAYALMRLFAF